MRSTRPPRLNPALMWQCLIILITSGGLYGETLTLPDLVLPLGKRPDIPPPAVYSDASSGWVAEPPAYRRLYPLEALDSPISQHLETDPLYPGVPDCYIDDFEDSMRSAPSVTGEIPQQFTTWSVSAAADIREGEKIEIAGTPGSFGALGVETFLPLGMEPLRPYSAGLTWMRAGEFGGNYALGIKDESKITPYSLLDLYWDRGTGTPDTYALQSLVYGGSPGAGSVRLNAKLDIPIGESYWNIRTGAGGGTWFGENETSWIADALLGVGYDFRQSPLRLIAGAQLAFVDSNLQEAAPYLDIIWKPESGWILSFRSGIEFGIQDPVFMRYETVESFDAEIPSRSKYRFNVSYLAVGGSLFRISLEYGYGRYAFAQDGVVVVDDERALRGEALGYRPVGNGVILLEVDFSYYMNRHLALWEASLAFEWQLLSAYFRGGTEDMILGEGFPGIRNEVPIMGVGLDRQVGENWFLGLFGYARLPWTQPSIDIHVNWRSE